MKQDIEIVNQLDENDAPSGGYAYGNGIAIDWQNGPLGTGAARREPNGAFVEDVLEICIQRLEHYQSSKFQCPENTLAIGRIKQAVEALQARTRARELREVEGTHEL